MVFMVLAAGNWESFGSNLNNAFYFVIDKIVDLMVFFMERAREIGRLALFIALLTAALNYVLTGTGLKENLIKILKATLFFIIIVNVYPRVIGWITYYTFSLARDSVYKDVKEHFDAVTSETEVSYEIVVRDYDYNNLDFNMYHSHLYNMPTQTVTARWMQQIRGNDQSRLFSDLVQDLNNKKTGMNFVVVAPAGVMKIVFFLAEECLGFADTREGVLQIPEFSRILKGIGCAVLLIFTGAFALLEYIVCLLEFMLVASVGIILLPLSIWEGSKFMAEGFIKAVLGFTLKLLFCNLAIFLCLYGFISLFYIITAKQEDGAMGFQGTAVQIIFIVFSSLLFFFVCKSAPGVAQSLVTGSPSLTGAGAIGAVAGAVGAVAGVAGLAKSAGSKVASTGAAVIGGGVSIGTKAAGVLSEAGSAAKAAGLDGGDRGNQAAAFLSSLGQQASRGIARSIYGGQSQDRTLGEMNDAGRQRGAIRGKDHMDKVRRNL